MKAFKLRTRSSYSEAKPRGANPNQRDQSAPYVSDPYMSNGRLAVWLASWLYRFPFSLHFARIDVSCFAPLVQVYPKPSREAQSEINGAKKVLLSDVYGTAKRKLLLNRSWGKVDVTYVAFMVFIHGLCLFAPMTFSWPMVGLFAVTYLISGSSTYPSILTDREKPGLAHGRPFCSHLPHLSWLHLSL
jgi:hypothetical protein